MISSTARMTTGPGTHDRSPPLRLLSSVSASSLVILCSFLSLPGRASPFRLRDLLSYIMSSPSTPPDMAPVTLTDCHDTTPDREL